MSLPTNFSGAPGEEVHRSFRNACNELKKIIKSSKDIEKLKWEMERFIEIAKQVNWHQKNTGVFHKGDGEKATSRLLSEFQRYAKDLQEKKNGTNPGDLLDSLAEVERLVHALKAT